MGFEYIIMYDIIIKRRFKMKQIFVNRFNVCPSEINYCQNRKFKYLSKTETEINLFDDLSLFLSSFCVL